MPALLQVAVAHKRGAAVLNRALKAPAVLVRAAAAVMAVVVAQKVPGKMVPVAKALMVAVGSSWAVEGLGRPLCPEQARPSPCHWMQSCPCAGAWPIAWQYLDMTSPCFRYGHGNCA